MMVLARTRQSRILKARARQNILSLVLARSRIECPRKLKMCEFGEEFIDLTAPESDLELEDSFGPPVCPGSSSVDATVIGQQAADYEDSTSANSDTDDSVYCY